MSRLSLILFIMRYSRTLPFLLLLPAMLVIGIVQLYPAFYTIFLSTRTIRAGELLPNGLENFRDVFGSELFRESAWTTAIFLFGFVALTLLAALGVALLLNRKLKLNSFYIALIFIPWVLSDVIVGLVWKLFVDPDSGLFAPFFSHPIFGLNGSAFLTFVPQRFTSSIPFPPAPALGYLVVAAAWKALPFITLLLLAALQTVPREVSESALTDGANRRQVFRFITLPLILPAVVVALFNLTLSGMNGVGMVFSLTGGGPGNATEVLSYLLYDIGFSQLDFGRAAALSVFIAVINLILIALTLRVTRRNTEAAT